MKKQLEQFAAEHTLSRNGNDMYGSYNGYQVSIRWGGWSSASFYVGFHVNLGNKMNEVVNWLNVAQKKQLRIANVTIDGSGLYCIFTNMTLGSSLKKAHEVLYAVTEYLKMQGIPGDVCPYCGQPMEEKKLVEDNYCLFYAHEACFNSKLSQVEGVESAEASMPNNYLRGFLGALIGGIVGMLIFWGLFQLGFLASISSLIGAVVGSLLYTKFGGKNNKMKIVIIAIVVFVLTAAAFFLCYLQVVSDAMAQAGVYGSAIEMLGYLLETDQEIRAAFWGDFAMSIIFTVVGIVVVAMSMVRQQKKVSSGMKKHS